MTTDLFKPNITEFDSEDQLYAYAESFVIDEMLEQIGEEGTFRLALSGGSTPLPLYQKLAHNQSLPWEEVEIYQTDERFVDTKGDDSNQKQIQANLGEEVLNRLKDTYFVKIDETLHSTTTHYNEVIQSLEEPFFDLTVLGIGADGHIASLFPNATYLAHNEDSVITTQASDQYPSKQRISLTLESILNSKTILVLLNGESKSHILGELVSGQKSAKEFPAKFLLAHPKLFVFACTQQPE
jgi:6-phosphogluconolactonase